jgi:hypothetical protein
MLLAITASAQQQLLDRQHESTARREQPAPLRKQRASKTQDDR